MIEVKKAFDHKRLVSVIITGRNRPEFLKEAVLSVVNQTYHIFQIIIVDDFSDKPLSDAVDALNLDVKIDHIRLKEQKGANYARNVGTKFSKGDYLAFLDDDDVFQPEKIQQQLLCCINSKVKISLCSYFLSNGKKTHTGETFIVTEKSLKTGNKYCGMSGLFIERRLLIGHMFDELLPCGQDWDLYVRLVASGEKVVFLDLPLFMYRVDHQLSITKQLLKFNRKEIDERLLSASKHRDWLGYKNYKHRVAIQILSNLEKKKNTCKWILYCIEHSGVITTLKILIRHYLKVLLRK